MYLLHYVGTAVLHTLDAGLPASSQYPEGPATGHLDTGFSWFPCVYKRMLRRFPSFPVATTCLSCSPPDLNFLEPCFIFMYMHYNHCHRGTAHLQINKYIWCDFDGPSSLICGNKMPPSSNRGFYYRSYCLLNMFRGTTMPIIRSSRVLYIHNPQLHTRPATWKTTARNTTGSNHCIILLSSWWWA